MNLKESKEGCVGGFERRKGDGWNDLIIISTNERDNKINK